MDLSGYSQAYLNSIPARLNEHPRMTLGFETPADKLRVVLHWPVESVAERGLSQAWILPGLVDLVTPPRGHGNHSVCESIPELRNSRATAFANASTSKPVVISVPPSTEMISP